MKVVDDFPSQLRQPEYTGENRCLPCTVVNSVLAVVAAICVGAATWSLASASLAVVAGTVSVLAGGALIYLRGYLAPGTPTLTKQYFPAWLLEAFGKQQTVEYRADGQGSLNQEAVLLDAGVLEEHPERDDLRLESSFQTEWYEEVDRVEETSDYEGVFQILDVDDGAVTMEEHGQNIQAKVNGSFVGTWKSWVMFHADISAATLLTEACDGWSDFDPHDRHELLSGLRLFIDRCPDCGGAPELGTETVETCCQAREVAALDCPDCGARLFETRT